jgi:hypothetical protein
MADSEPDSGNYFLGGTNPMSVNLTRNFTLSEIYQILARLEKLGVPNSPAYQILAKLKEYFRLKWIPLVGIHVDGVKSYQEWSWNEDEDTIYPSSE